MTVTTEASVRDNSELSRFEIWLGGELAGFAVYRDRPGRVVFIHTEIEPAYKGKGLGEKLAAAALDNVVSRGLTIVPLCPFIAAYIEKHPEYAAHVGADHGGESAAGTT